MLVTNLLALALASLAVAETQHDARANIGGTLYRQDNFRGESRRLEEGRCISLTGPLRDEVRSIRVSPRSDCYLYFQENCRGGPRRQERSNNRIRFTRVRSARCVRDR
ncbi:hypothetical protein HIM_07547 [Hirsutella minnesotensis 3608]|uniref:Beta/gamma crystallin 'Greek key' domain-containing protein n=1 Tax=Hirsutella minnesotensis 3608 TaxID=1043627 RepID=A0A0F7ZN18_9HYPO|nr:hypothetical protein HIM_07547 [Hirsutella minnesotensis 3608]